MPVPSDHREGSALHAEPACVPLPPRYRWLRRILLLTLGFALAVVVLRLLWGWQAERRLLAEIERIKASGEPIDAARFVPKDDPAGLETQRLTVSAAEKFDWGPDGETLREELAEGAVWPLDKVTAVAAIIEANAPVLADYDRAMRMSAPAWFQAAPSMKAFATNPVASDIRRFAHFLALSIHYDHQRGDHLAAIRGFERSAFLARVVATESGLIPHLNLMACDAVWVRQVQYVAPTLCIAPHCDGTDLTPVPTETVDALIETILDDEYLRSSVQRAFQFERVLVVNLLREFADGELTITRGAALAGLIPGRASLWQRAHVVPFAPLLLDRATLYLRQSPELDALASMTSHTEFRKVRLALPAGELDERLSQAPGVLGDLFEILLQMSADDNAYALLLHARLLTEHRLAAIRLALRLYELEHGQMPETLESLAPTYLATVPDDPFAAPGTGFRYRPDDRPPVLYSIGANGIDDGGRVGGHWTGHDVVFFLDGIEPDAE